jgi:nucleotide-binding universal stress UspA family protein
MSDSARPTILVPIGQTVGQALLDAARECARALGARVLLIHVAGSDDRRQAASVRAYLDTLCAQFASAGIEAEAVQRTGNVAATVLAEARRAWAAAIVLGASRRPAVLSAVVGSISSRIMRGASCPVVLVDRAPGQQPRPPLWSFAQAAERSGPLVPRVARRETVDVVRIVGSVGRASELAADFRPPHRRRRRHDEQRLQRIRDVLECGRSLPPIEFYKLGSGYYVLDGHHRVAATLLAGQAAMDAVVVEHTPITQASH